MNRTMSAATTFALILVSAFGRAEDSRPNILFIAVADLRLVEVGHINCSVGSEFDVNRAEPSVGADDDVG